uniref:Uncharacterized protein n=1 Tax=Pararge aegeria TaxID=116150 RepID=S4PFF3_9NEOP
MFGSSPTRQSPGYNSPYTSSAPGLIRAFTCKAFYTPQFSGSGLNYSDILNIKNKTVQRAYCILDSVRCYYL